MFIHPDFHSSVQHDDKVSKQILRDSTSECTSES